jgi:hypothetical protein
MKDKTMSELIRPQGYRSDWTSNRRKISNGQEFSKSTGDRYAQMHTPAVRAWKYGNDDLNGELPVFSIADLNGTPRNHQSLRMEGMMLADCKFISW